jgi:predicted N-acetyltransferase YhbS
MEEVPMNVTLRPGNAKDAKHCGAICYEAFKTIAEQHNFPPDFPSPEVATALLTGLLAHPGFYAVVAELDGRVVGSNFLDERSTVAGIGPITVDPAVQNRAVGRQLMQHVLDRVTQQRYPGVRLVQAAYHNRSLSLYGSVGVPGPRAVVHHAGGASRRADSRIHCLTFLRWCVGPTRRCVHVRSVHLDSFQPYTSDWN